jgi:hypothetical protein
LQANLTLPFVISLKIEYALVILPFYEYTLSKKLILEAMSNFGLEINFTGKLGVRTKYQQFQVPQLVVEIQRTKDTEDEAILTGKSSEETPKIAKLDEIEDNILYETPILTSVLNTKNNSNQPKNDGSEYYSFVDVEGVKKLSDKKPEQKENEKQISISESICILALIKHLLIARPIDDMLREQITAYIEKCLEKYSSWSILLNQLMIRSDLEFRHNKKLDRAMIQYEAIMEDSNSKKGSAIDRIRFLNIIHYPSFLEISTKFAKNYMKLNAYMSASIVFEEVNQMLIMN